MSEIKIPKEVQEIFDAADESGNNSAVIGEKSVKLVNKHGEILKEVEWADVIPWSRTFLTNVLTKVKEEGN